MYVCVCHAVTDKDIRNAVAEGCDSLRDLRQQLLVGRTCGRCTQCARELLREQQAPNCATLPAANPFRFAQAA